MQLTLPYPTCPLKGNQITLKKYMHISHALLRATKITLLYKILLTNGGVTAKCCVYAKFDCASIGVYPHVLNP
jgi:hypothetical protein